MAQAKFLFDGTLGPGAGLAVPADPAAKGFTGSTHRLVSPEETLSRVGPYLPVMGITRVANVTGLDSVGIPVVMVTRPNSRSVSVSQGKGVDLAAAKASGVMESIESYHAESIDLPLKLGSHEDLRYKNAIVDVERLPRLLDRHHCEVHWTAEIEDRIRKYEMGQW